MRGGCAGRGGGLRGAETGAGGGDGGGRIIGGGISGSAARDGGCSQPPGTSSAAAGATIPLATQPAATPRTSAMMRSIALIRLAL